MKNPFQFAFFLIAVTITAGLVNGQSVISTPGGLVSDPFSALSAPRSNGTKYSGFSTVTICSLPADFAGKLSALGGGTWQQNSYRNFPFACAGGNDSVTIREKGLEAEVSYYAGGEGQAALNVEFSYISVPSNEGDPREIELRRQFAAAAEKLAVRFYGQPLSEEFRTRLSDATKYVVLPDRASCPLRRNGQPPGQEADVSHFKPHAEKIGSGYAFVMAIRAGTGLYAIGVVFFANEAAYRKLDPAGKYFSF
jgi:hypothetical protein